MFSIFNPLAILLSLSAATGVLIHDMHIDSAASAAMALPVVINHYDVGNKLSVDQHTHVERTSVVNDLRAENPRVQPRTEDKKYLLQKRVMRGHHAFDNYNLPIV